MLEYREMAQPTTFRSCVPPRPSSAGAFDLLPFELIHRIFQYLDLPTLQNFGYTSIRGRLLLEALSNYRELVTYAPRSLACLKRTDQITLHSIAQVRDALTRPRCFTCSDFAPLLYMPTCDRCCLNCLFYKRSLRMLPLSNASLCFGLTLNESRNLLRLLSVPGTYGSPSHNYPKRLLLVSAKHAHEAGVHKYSGINSMEDAVRQADARRAARHYQRCTTSSSSNQDLRHPPRKPTYASQILSDPNDPYRFMGSTPMPWLSSSKEVQHGIWCLGCYYSWLGFTSHEVHLGDKGSYEPGDDLCQNILRRERRAFDRVEFLEHVRHCSGAIRWAKTRTVA